MNFIISFFRSLFSSSFSSKPGVVKGQAALAEFIPFLLPRVASITTRCDEFALIDLGHFDPAPGGIVSIGQVLLKTGGRHPQHSHAGSDATFYFSGGKGFVILGDEKKRVPYRNGSVVAAPRGVSHGFEVLEAGLMISIQRGSPIRGENGELDIKYVEEECFTEHGTVGG